MRLRIKLGDAEFDCEGSLTDVARARDEFIATVLKRERLLGRTQGVKVQPKARPNSGKPEGE